MAVVEIVLHPVSITRFPLSIFSRGWVRKDGNLLTETGCNIIITMRISIMINDDTLSKHNHNNIDNDDNDNDSIASIDANIDSVDNSTN